MPEVVMALSVGNVKALAANMKNLAKALRDDIITVDIEKQTCALIADEARDNIGAISRLDGNYLGGDNPNTSVMVKLGLNGYDVVWRGEQIFYLEFGTGAAGAATPYPGVAMAAAGYMPDSTKDSWWYTDAKIGSWVSLSLAPQAPMYQAAKVGRAAAISAGRAVLKGALRDAVVLQ